MNTTSGSMTKIQHNSRYHITYNRNNIREHDKHLLLLHKHAPELINEFVNNELWHEWKNKYFRGEHDENEM